MLNKRKESIISIIWLSLALILEFIFKAEIYILYVLIGLIILVVLGQIIHEYRIKKRGELI